jgi:hypothetical protein
MVFLMILNSFPGIFRLVPYDMQTVRGVFQTQEKPTPQWDRLCTSPPTKELPLLLAIVRKRGLF